MVKVEDFVPVDQDLYSREEMLQIMRNFTAFLLSDGRVQIKSRNRMKQYYLDDRDSIHTYFTHDRNPCGCGSNCYHKEYDPDDEKVYGVCNACNMDIYEYEDTEEVLGEGIWK
jgi:hypothetical protein